MREYQCISPTRFTTYDNFFLFTSHILSNSVCSSLHSPPPPCIIFSYTFTFADQHMNTFLGFLTSADPPLSLSSSGVSSCWWAYEHTSFFSSAGCCLPLSLLLQFSPQAIFTQGWLNSPPPPFSLHCSLFLLREGGETTKSHHHMCMNINGQTIVTHTAHTDLHVGVQCAHRQWKNWGLKSIQTHLERWRKGQIEYAKTHTLIQIYSMYWSKHRTINWLK